MKAAETQLFPITISSTALPLNTPHPPPQKKKKPMETPAPWAVHENEFKYWDRALKIWSEMLILRKIPWKDRTVLKKYETLKKSLPRGMD